MADGPRLTAGYKPAGQARRLFRRALPEYLREAAWRAVNRRAALERVWAAVDPTIRHKRVTAATDLVIEGYPRVGNTYAVAAFEYANGTYYRVTNHFHTLLSVNAAVRLHRPTIILIREPAAALSSIVQFNDRYTTSSALAAYRRYYERIVEVLPDVVLADFREVIADFGAVIRACNERFGTSFEPYVRTPEAEEVVMEAVSAVAADHSPERFATRVRRALCRPPHRRRGGRGARRPRPSPAHARQGAPPRHPRGPASRPGGLRRRSSAPDRGWYRRSPDRDRPPPPLTAEPDHRGRSAGP